MKKLIFIIMGTIFLTTGCGNGSNGNTSTALQKSLNNSMLTSQPIQLKLYNSIYLTPQNSYKFDLQRFNTKDNAGELVAQGKFTCEDVTSCSVNLNLGNTRDLYYFVVYNSDNKFIGAALFSKEGYDSEIELSLDDLSTSAYLSMLMMNKLQDAFNIANVETRLFKPIMNFKPDLNMTQVIYAYFMYLTTTKGMSFEEAIKHMSEQYTKCEMGTCAIDNDFTKNDAAITNILQTINNNIEALAKDKDDSQLYSSYLWFKNSPIPGAISTVTGIAENFFPGASGLGVGDKLGVAFDVVGSFFESGGILSNSKEAYDRIQTVSQNVTKSYKQSPNYTKMIYDVFSASFNHTVINEFDDALDTSLANYNSVNNKLVMKDELDNKGSNRESFGYYIKYYKDLGHSDQSKDFSSQFSWIIDPAPSDSGIWGKTSVEKRKDALNYLLNKSNIQDLADNFKRAAFKDNYPGETLASGANSIEQIQLYNEAILMYMQKSINALQYTMFLDGIALQILDGVIPVDVTSDKAVFNRMQLVAVQKVGAIVTGNYEDDQARLWRYYRGQLLLLGEIYKNYILAEKKFVPVNVMQTLETKEQCRITYLDSNEMKARCPYFYEDKDTTKFVYKTATLDKPALKCQTMEKDGSGDMSKIADVQYINGTLQCLTTNLVSLGNLIEGTPSINTYYEKSNQPSIFNNNYNNNYSVQISSLFNAEHYIRDYFLNNYIVYKANLFTRTYNSTVHQFNFIPTPILNGNDEAYTLKDGKMVYSNNGAYNVGTSMDNHIYIKDKSGNNASIIYIAPTLPRADTPVSLDNWTPVPGIQYNSNTPRNFRVNAGNIGLYSNQEGSILGNEVTIKNHTHSAETFTIDFSTIYTEYDKNYNNIYSVFMPIINYISPKQVDIKVKFDKLSGISNVKVASSDMEGYNTKQNGDEGNVKGCRGEHNAYKVFGSGEYHSNSGELLVKVRGTFEGDKRNTCILTHDYDNNKDETYFIINKLVVSFDYAGTPHECIINQGIGTSFDGVRRRNDKLQGYSKGAWISCSSNSNFEYKLTAGSSTVFTYSPGDITIRKK